MQTINTSDGNPTEQKICDHVFELAVEIADLKKECRHFHRQNLLLIEQMNHLGGMVQKHERDISLRLIEPKDSRGVTLRAS